MEQHYLFISSGDSKDIFPENAASHFIIQLPETLNLEGMWYCSLTEICINSEQKRPKELIICSDFCEDSFVGGKRLGVLRRVISGVGGELTRSFHHPYYLKVNRNHLKQLSFHIKDENLASLELEGRTLLTIHLRKTTIS